METRLPPPVVMILTGFCMWLLARAWPEAAQPIPGGRGLALVLVIAALVLAGAAAWELYRHRTTINPMMPGQSSALVTSGVFAWSRNPIYVADALLLFAWTIHLAYPLAIVGIPLFMGYIHRYQIRPEEQALEARFGNAFRDYRQRVRRWI